MTPLGNAGHTWRWTSEKLAPESPGSVAGDERGQLRRDAGGSFDDGEVGVGVLFVDLVHGGCVVTIVASSLEAPERARYVPERRYELRVRGFDRDSMAAGPRGA